MADSDSEAFESADEDVEEKKHVKTEKITHPVKPTKSEAEPPAENVPEEAKSPTQQAPSSWRSWGAFSVINNASKKVASITTSVSQSISTAIDSMNIPEPEEMAKIQAEQRKTVEEDENEVKSSENSEESMFKLDNLLSGVTQISSKVVSGGLETLEGIGKKTINILQESDPNIKNKLRELATSGSKPNLSDLLKEAKEREDEVMSTTASDSAAVEMSFEHQLDEHKGLVFLEALEILSNQSKMKIDMLLKPLSGKTLNEMEETLDEVKELCEFDAESFDESLTMENLESKLQSATEDLNVKLNFSEIVAFTAETRKTLESDGSGREIYNKSIDIMAKSCALSLNNLQKLAELLLSLDHRSTADEADSLTQLATIYCSLFNLIATKFSEKFSGENTADSKKMSTNLFFESSNAIVYVKKAFNLFLPVLQIGAV